MDVSHNKTIQKEFAKQAGEFEKRAFPLARQDCLEWMVKHLLSKAGPRVLDVAAGTGHLSRAIAPHVEEVVAIDATPAMLMEGRKQAERSGITNITFEEGFAEHLPYPDHAFDMIVCRFGVHHFQQPSVQLHEMSRVCKPGGSVGIIDLVSPSNERLAESYNYFERLRDSSHTVALSEEALTRLIADTGLTISRTDPREVEVNVELWLGLTKASKAVSNQIKDRLIKEIHGGSKTGMRPFMKNGELMFLQTWFVVLGEKIV